MDFDFAGTQLIGQNAVRGQDLMSWQDSMGAIGSPHEPASTHAKPHSCFPEMMFSGQDLVIDRGAVGLERSEKVDARRPVEGVGEIAAQRRIQAGDEAQIRDSVIGVVSIIAMGWAEDTVSLILGVVCRAGVQGDGQVSAEKADDGLGIEGDIPFKVIRRRRRTATCAKMETGEFPMKQLRLAVVSGSNATRGAERHSMHREFRFAQDLQQQLARHAETFDVSNVAGYAIG